MGREGGGAITCISDRAVKGTQTEVCGVISWLSGNLCIVTAAFDDLENVYLIVGYPGTS